MIKRATILLILFCGLIVPGFTETTALPQNKQTTLGLYVTASLQKKLMKSGRLTLAQEGFKNVYTITDGFEGEEVKDENSYFKGKRMINGWKNSGAPWTYELNPELVFRSFLQY